MRIEVRNNNVDKAMRILKKKLQVGAALSKNHLDALDRRAFTGQERDALGCGREHQRSEQLPQATAHASRAVLLGTRLYALRRRCQRLRIEARLADRRHRLGNHGLRGRDDDRARAEMETQGVDPGDRFQRAADL